ncbi:MAG: methylated-DNA--[protein]-cysteine S-methyltransferase [Gemmatimonadaceae bacterium]
MEDGRQTEADEGEKITVGFASSSLGTVLVGATKKGVRFVKIGDDADSLRDDLSRHLAGATTENDEAADAVANSVARLIDNSGNTFDAPLDIRGTRFQQTVWQALREIPPGSTVTYAGLAAKIGRTSAIRAVARACATNDLAVIIPCHRVIRSDGNLAGYRWGIDRKRALLEREASAIFSYAD